MLHVQIRQLLGSGKMRFKSGNQLKIQDYRVTVAVKNVLIHRLRAALSHVNVDLLTHQKRVAESDAESENVHGVRAESDAFVNRVDKKLIARLVRGRDVAASQVFRVLKTD